MQRNWNLYNCWCKCKMGQPLWKNSLAVPQNGKHGVTILLLGVYLRELKTYICTKPCYMNVHSSFTVAQMW